MMILMVINDNDDDIDGVDGIDGIDGIKIRTSTIQVAGNVLGSSSILGGRVQAL